MKREVVVPRDLAVANNSMSYFFISWMVYFTHNYVYLFPHRAKHCSSVCAMVTVYQHIDKFLTNALIFLTIFLQAGLEFQLETLSIGQVRTQSD